MNTLQQTMFDQLVALTSANGWEIVSDKYEDQNTKMTFKYPLD